MEPFRQDLRFAIRQLLRSPGFAVVAILTLALGIGANTAVFSVVDAVLLRQLPFAEPDRLVTPGYMMTGEYLLVRDRSRTLDDIALQASLGFNLSGEGDPRRVSGARVSANLFAVLGATPILGRGFLEGEDRRGADPVVVLGHGLWVERFEADPDVVGRETLVDGEPRIIVGVMPPGFRFPDDAIRLWVPFAFDPSDAAALWGGAGGQAVARLAEGASVAGAQTELRALAPDIRAANTLWSPPPDFGATREVVPLHDTIVRGVRTRLWVLLGAVGFVLLIACANVANLLLARAAGREREVALRNALGAGRSRIARQLLTESALLGGLGGALGLLFAVWGVRLLVGSLPADIPRAAGIGIDPRVMGFTLAASAIATLLFGSFPALRSIPRDLRSTLKSGERGASPASGRLAGPLVTAEFALAVVLVIGAGLLIRSFGELSRVDPGFESEGLITSRVTPPETDYPDAASRRAFYDELLTRVRALPGVREVDAVDRIPLASGSYAGFAFEIEDDPYVPGTEAPVVGDRRVTPGYLRTMGIPLLRGRGLEETDREGSPKVALINQTMARTYWPGEDPIGLRFKEVWLDEWTIVVGVVGDVRTYGLASEVEAEIYRPFAQMPTRELSLAVRATGDLAGLADGLRAAVAAIDPHVPVTEIRPVARIVEASMAGSRFTMALVGAFALLALALAAVGIYGVLSYTVGRRTREIGVRVALGARAADVLGSVLGRALVLSGAGAAVGVVGALGATRLLESLLYGVAATDPLTFVAVPLALVAVALLASYVPARRATRIDPMTALRQE